MHFQRNITTHAASTHSSGVVEIKGGGMVVVVCVHLSRRYRFAILMDANKTPHSVCDISIMQFNTAVLERALHTGVCVFGEHQVYMFK